MARVRFSSLFASHTSLLDLTALYALCVNSSTVSGPALIALELSVCLEFAPNIERFAGIPYILTDWPTERQIQRYSMYITTIAPPR